MRTLLSHPMTVFVFLVFIIACGSPEKTLPDEAIAGNNRGVGLMGYFQYQQAHDVFVEVVEAHPDWHAAKINLAIATLNLQTEGSEQRALDLLAEVLAQDPDNLRARYCTGLLNLYLGQTDIAVQHFRGVAEADPSDAYAAYYLAQCLGREGKAEEAEGWYRKSLETDAYLRSAYYGLFQIYQRGGDRQKAKDMLEQFQKLEDNPQARQVEFKYTRMGPKATAETVDIATTPAVEPQGDQAFGPVLPLTLPEASAERRPVGDSATGMTLADIDADGHLDIFIPAAYEKDSQTANAIILNGGDNSLFHQFEHPLFAVKNVNTAAWGDFDNDGLVDVYLARNGANAMFRQSAKGEWDDITSAASAGGGNFNTVDVIWFDADHDGDLDLFLVNDNGPDELLNNNLDGTFRPLAETQGLSGGDRASRQVLVGDLDNDRDVDILVIHAQPPHAVYANDRLWNYQPASGFDDFISADITRIVSADRNTDGQPELYTQSSSGTLSRWEPGANGIWQKTTLPIESDGQLAVMDLWGTGRLGILTGPAGGWPSHWLDLSNDDEAVALNLAKDDVARWVPAAWEPGKGYTLFGRQPDGNLLQLTPGDGRWPFASFSFSGKESKADSMRSNRSGIGTRFAVRTGSRWTSGDSFRAYAGPGQSLQPRPIGIGAEQTMDFLAINWSDGVFQTELNLETGKYHPIEETQRQLSSCPVLFVWNGEAFEFVSDLLGVAGMGYAIGRGQYATPRPWENFQIPEGVAQPQDGVYAIKIGEPMEEACYLDAVGMVAHDLPPGWDLVLDERMGLAEPLPTGEVRYFRQSFAPKLAMNDRGQDVTQSIMSTDQSAAPLPVMDRRFIGRLASDHVLDIDFGRAIGDGPGKPVLIADGWVEYPYSQTQFSAWQAGAEFRAPTLSAKMPDGTWRIIHDRFGYPAGMPRRMSLPLDAVPADAVALRLSSNLEIYWDRIALAYVEPLPDARTYRFELLNADLAAEGFAKRTTGKQRLPHYNDSERVPLWDTRHQAGYYSSLGAVTPLLNKQDDALAIFGPGEAVTVRFRNTAPMLLQGWRRVLVLETAGWCKDMDLYTRDGETIEPLPTTGADKTNRDALHEEFNTRFESGF